MSVPPEDKSTGQPGEPCNCIALVNESMKEHNTILDTCYLFSRETGAYRTTVRLSVALAEKKRGARPTAILPDFCPFCGVRYQREEGES